MNTYINHVGILIGYTIFYHGLYYCPKINTSFDYLIKRVHNCFIDK